MPVRGGATISPRVPLPIGQTKSSTRVESSSAAVSRMNRLLGKSGVRLSKWVLSLALSGSSWSTASTLSSAKKRSFSLGGRIWPGDEVASLEVEPADLGRRDINVFRAGQIVEALGSEEAKAFRQDFQDAFGEEHPGPLRVFLQDVKDDLMLAHGAEVLDAQLARHLVQLHHGHGLELGDVQRGGGDAVLVFASPGLPLGLFVLDRRRRLGFLRWGGGSDRFFGLALAPLRCGRPCCRGSDLGRFHRGGGRLQFFNGRRRKLGDSRRDGSGFGDRAVWLVERRWIGRLAFALLSGSWHRSIWLS